MNFVKNPNRKISKYKKYIPNYVLLDRDPVVLQSSPEDWRYAKEKNNMRKQKPNLQLTNNPVRVKGYPQRMAIPSSGQNSEHLWREQEEYATVSPQDLQDLEEQEELVGKEKIYATDDNDDEILSVQKIPEYQFGIYVGNELVHITESIEEAETAVEFLLFSKKSPFKDLDISDISVIQKIAMKYGVCISKP